MKTDALKKYLLPNLPYLVIFWAANRIAYAYREAVGADLLAKLGAMLGGLPAAFTFSFSLHPRDLLFGFAGAGCIWLVVYFKKKNVKKYRKDVEYGSARWGTPEDIKPFVDPVFKNNVILTASEFLTMNSRPKNPALARNKNCLITGGSGSGKTRFWLTPNLLQLHSSYCVVDPKGGTLTDCGKLLLAAGYKLKIFNTIDFKKSMHFNPLAYIKDEKDILRLVNTLVENTKGDQKGGDDFWQKAMVLLFCALIGYIHYEAPEEERNLNMLVDMVNAMEVREDDPTFKNTVDLMFENLERRDPNHFAVRQYQKFRLAAGKTMKSILITCGAVLSVFDIQELHEVLAYDEMELDLQGDRKTATFFIISDTDTTFNFLVAIAMSMMMNRLCERADNKFGGRLPHHVRILWDEAANTGKISSPPLPILASVIRSRELSLNIFLQSPNQYKALYKDDAQTIFENMDAQIFLGGRGESLKALADSLGKETIDLYNTSENRGSQISHGVNYQKLGKELMSQDEIAVLDNSKCILQLRGVRPFLSSKYDLTKHPNYKYTADFDRRNAFDVDKYLDTRLKPQAKQAFDVWEIN